MKVLIRKLKKKIITNYNSCNKQDDWAILPQRVQGMLTLIIEIRSRTFNSNSNFKAYLALLHRANAGDLSGPLLKEKKYFILVNLENFRTVDLLWRLH